MKKIFNFIAKHIEKIGIGLLIAVALIVFIIPLCIALGRFMWEVAFTPISI